MNTNELAYARCTACDSPFYPSRPVSHRFESLCHECLSISMRAARTDTVLYHNGVTDSFKNKDHNNDQQWLDSITETFTDYSDLWDEDDYLCYGEDAFGSIKLLEDY